MGKKDGLTELALMFRDRENKNPSSITTGIIVASPPTPQIRLNELIVLDSEELVFNSDAAYENGEEVILMPSSDNQLYYVLGKAVRY